MSFDNMKDNKSDFRCKKCHQLQFKYRLKGDKLEIEVKCYNDNVFNYFTIWLNKSNIKKYETNNKRK